MNDNDLITRREVELALLEKGQKSERYKLGEQWELNFSEIREALSEYQPEMQKHGSVQMGKGKMTHETPERLTRRERRELNRIVRKQRRKRHEGKEET